MPIAPRRGLDLPVLLDVDNGFFAGMHYPRMPSTVIIAPDGSLAEYYSGFGDDMEDVLKRQAMTLVEQR